jgi:hypothetical protein
MDGPQGMSNFIATLLMEELLENHSHQVFTDREVTGPAHVGDDSLLFLLPLITSSQAGGATPTSTQGGGWDNWMPLLLLLLLRRRTPTFPLIVSQSEGSGTQALRRGAGESPE